MNGPRGWRAPRWESSPQRPPAKSILPEKMFALVNETKKILLVMTCLLKICSLTKPDSRGPGSPPDVHSRSTQTEEDNPRVTERGLPGKC